MGANVIQKHGNCVPFHLCTANMSKFLKVNILRKKSEHFIFMIENGSCTLELTFIHDGIE